MSNTVVDILHCNHNDDDDIIATNFTAVHVSVLLMCGLPGSGKSTLAQSIVHHYRHRSYYCTADSATGGDNDDDDGRPSSYSFDKVVYIEYDEITNSFTDKIILKNDYANDVMMGQEEQGEVSNGNEKDDCEKEEFSLDLLEAWRETRFEALRLFKNELESISCYNHRRKLNDTKFPTSSYKVLIVMDDNFHLRSMRRDLYKVCQSIIQTTHVQDGDSLGLEQKQSSQTMHIAFVTIHVNTPLEKCIENNEQRIGTKRYIPKRIIRKMYHTMEPPNGDKVHFERLSMDTCDLDVNHACPNSSFYQQLESLMKQSSVDPIIVKKDLEALEQDRLATFKSIMHRIDLNLRSLVGTVCQTNKIYAKYANRARKIILTECREDGSTLNKFLRQCHPDDDVDNQDDDDMDVTITPRIQGWLRNRYEEILLGDIVDADEIRSAIQKASLL
mmetsp:Transcript_4781/g.9128  ORF Transcript_4781/g.9128 Transcript_4781/m.9128 type:complete len:444 (+) Transcript_4781:96-1427(+)